MEEGQHSGLSAAARILESDEGLIMITDEDGESSVLEKIASEYGIEDEVTYVDESGVDGYETPRAITQGDGILRNTEQIIGLLDTLAYKTGTSSKGIQQVHQKYQKKQL